MVKGIASNKLRLMNKLEISRINVRWYGFYFYKPSVKDCRGGEGIAVGNEARERGTPKSLTREECQTICNQ